MCQPFFCAITCRTRRVPSEDCRRLVNGHGCTTTVLSWARSAKKTDRVPRTQKPGTGHRQPPPGSAGTHRRRPHAHRPGREHRHGAPLLDRRRAHPPGDSRGEAGRVRRADCRDGVGTIDSRLRPVASVARNLFQHDTLRRGVPRSADCRRRCLHNWAGATSSKSFPSTTRSSATSTPRCAGWSAGASARCAPGSTACSSSAPPSPRSRRRSSGRNLARLREEDRLTPDLVFRDPYVLDFLRLHDSLQRGGFGAAILRELEAFLLELGGDFAFVARQKRITVDNEDYYLDLLFFHRRLRRLLAVELKMGKFQAADKGQMELYLRWLDRHDRAPGEETPIGLILCAGKSARARRVAASWRPAASASPTYLTELPPRPAPGAEAPRRHHSGTAAVGRGTGHGKTGRG